MPADLNGKKDATGKKRNVFVRLVDRFKSYLPIIIAVLIRAYKMSQSVGWAMESRGLNLQGVRRTYRIQLKMRLSDWIILAVTVAATAGSIWPSVADEQANVPEQTTHRITTRDLKVVSALQCDGRMTMQALTDKSAFRLRGYGKLRRPESGIMSIVPVCNPLSLGNYSQVLVGLRLDGSRDEALAMLQSMPQVTYVVCALRIPTSSLAVVYSAERAWIISSNMVCARCRLSRLPVFSCGRLVNDDHNVSVVNRLLAAHGETSYRYGARRVSAPIFPRIVWIHGSCTHSTELQKDGKTFCVVGERLSVTHTAIHTAASKTRRFRRDANCRMLMQPSSR